MPLTNLIVGAAILDGTKTGSKAELIRQLLDCFVADGHLIQSDLPSIAESILRREVVASTGIGAGVGVPHAKHASIRRPMAMLAIVRPAVTFDSIDGELTDIFVLCLSPVAQPGESLRASNESIELLRTLSNAAFRDRLRGLTSPEAIMELISIVDDGAFRQC